MARKEYTGGAAAAKLSAGIGSAPTTVSIDVATGWPVGTFPFIAVVDRGIAGKEEKKRFSGRSGTTLTVDTGGNGVDGTAAVAHDSGATIEHCLDAESLTDFARHVYDTTSDDHAQYLNNARHDITARHAFGAALGAPGTPATVGTAATAGTGVAPARDDHAHVLAAGIAGDGLSLTAGVLAVVVDGATLEIVTDTVRIKDLGVTTAKLADLGVTTGKLADLGVATGKLADNAVTAAKLADNSVDTSALVDGNVTKPKLEAAMQLPSGALTAFAGSTTPTGWLLCSGAAVSRTTYADLFAVIGTTYGAGDGSTTFNLPDLRGRTPVGLDNMGGTDAGRLSFSNTLGLTGGEQNHTLSTAEMPSHTHNPPGGFSIVYANLGGGDIYGGGTIGFASAAAMTSTGGGGAHNVMQPFMLTNWIIKT